MWSQARPDARRFHRLFAEHFNAGDAEGILALYEEGAVLAPQPGMLLEGKAAIRPALGEILATRGTFEMIVPVRLSTASRRRA